MTVRLPERRAAVPVQTAGSGWWPDGLYTAPTDEALVYDIEKTRVGFNMIRKHIKVEPARWYWHCDRLGTSSGRTCRAAIRPTANRSGRTKLLHGRRETAWQYFGSLLPQEWREIIDALRGFVSIGVWVPFNEAWGQFKTVEIAEWSKAYDPTRLVNPASGGNHQTGDMLICTIIPILRCIFTTRTAPRCWVSTAVSAL